MSLRVRPATPEDAPLLAALAPAGERERRALAWRAALDGGARAWLALERGEPVGLIAAGPAVVAGAAALDAFAVRAGAAGAGGALWEAAGAALAAEGARTMTLWVEEGDDGARAVAEAAGARADGATRAEPTGRRSLRYGAALPEEPFLRGLADALVCADAPSLARFMDMDVQFSAPPCAGPATVAAAMLGRAAAPPDALEELRREVSPVSLGAGRWRLNLSERLRERGQAASWRYAFALTLPAGRPVTRVQALDLPGERERLRAFMRKVGIST